VNGLWQNTYNRVRPHSSLGYRSPAPIGDLVMLYALLAKMQLTASPATIHAADAVIDRIIDAYLAPNRSLHDIHELAREGRLNFLTDFGTTCRLDLQTPL
jgi:hypothetical protein